MFPVKDTAISQARSTFQASFCQATLIPDGKSSPNAAFAVVPNLATHASRVDPITAPAASNLTGDRPTTTVAVGIGPPAPELREDGPTVWPGSVARLGSGFGL